MGTKSDSPGSLQQNAVLFSDIVVNKSLEICIHFLHIELLIVKGNFSEIIKKQCLIVKYWLIKFVQILRYWDYCHKLKTC